MADSPCVSDLRVQRPEARWAVVAPTWRDTKQTCFLGESGIVAVAQRAGLYRAELWKPSEGILRLPNGSLIIGYSADKPDRLRGPQHHGAWAEELAAWRYADAWDQLRFGLRLGDRPRTVVTTTPRPTPLIRNLHAHPRSHVTTGSTFENAPNLADDYLDDLRERYEGTRLGRQERRKNVAGAFVLAEGKSVDPAKRYVVIDDVLTTGATLHACAIALRKAGAECVDAAALCHG